MKFLVPATAPPLEPIPNSTKRIKVHTTAVGLDPPVDATYALILNESSNAIRWRDDGVDPNLDAQGVQGIGMTLFGGQALQYQGNLAALRMIAAGDATSSARNIVVVFYR